MSALRFHRLLSCVISSEPALPLQLAVFLIFASFVTYTAAWSAPRSKVASGANQDCAHALAAGVEQNSVDMTAAKISDDQISELIQNLVALKQKADEGHANGQGPRNNHQLMFEDQYRDALKEMPYLGARFTEAYVAARSGHQQSVEQERVERAERLKQSRRLKSYKISKRTDLDWSDPRSSKLVVNEGMFVEFYSASLGRVLNLYVRSDDSRIGHTSYVPSAVLVSENHFLTTSGDYTAILWEVDSLGEARIVMRLGVVNNKNPEVGHTSTVGSVVVVSENRFLTTSWDHTAILWEVDSKGAARIVSRLGEIGNQNSEVGHTSPVLSAALVTENLFLTTSTDHTSILWEVDSKGAARIVSRLGMIDNKNPEVGHTLAVRSAVSVSANRFLTTSEDHTSILWEVDSKGAARIVSRLGVIDNQNPEVGHTFYVTSAVVVTENRFITISGDHTSILWEVNSKGAAHIVSRLGLVSNTNPKLGHISIVMSAAHQFVDGDLILWTRDVDGRELIWEPEYATEGGEL